VRLDHLLSKEHAPIAGRRCGGRVDGVSLVESSMNDFAVVCGSCLSTAYGGQLRLAAVGVEPGAVVGGVGFLTHCWALRNQASVRVIRVVGWLVSWFLILG
jgi:hypothetical protein